jgi:hypothetical protein
MSKVQNKNAEESKKSEAVQKLESSTFMKLFSCVLYGGASSGLTFVNKSIYEKFGFESPLDVSLISALILPNSYC